MKTVFLLFALLFSISIHTQAQTSLPHGKIFGDKPDTTGVMPASQVEVFMGLKPRVSVAVRGKVIRVVKEKGGWFDIDEGKGRVIAAHFKNYDVTIPTSLKGKTIVADVVAQKQFIADDQQHFAGDTVNGKKQSQVKTNPKRRITFEVKGMMVE